MASDDYIYSIGLPHLDTVEMAVPERTHVLEFQTESAATLDLLGSQMCGFAHPDPWPS